jgi:hypothetical protein
MHSGALNLFGVTGEARTLSGVMVSSCKHDESVNLLKDTEGCSLLNMWISASPVCCAAVPWDV